MLMCDVVYSRLVTPIQYSRINLYQMHDSFGYVWSFGEAPGKVGNSRSGLN